ncbi:MAG: GDP-mannose-dependent monoacylated alpha-(1-6)-phosphatidylinositol monomannoside mannosyltransferase [Acidimicrobiales bacterium]|nr:MAG: glycosyltransferase family 1 protein [Actinomycetota bacterium]MBV6508794.1 GDP-mannose-dependent monoacylated alpha-(1-6)-phosphatidylinositol monomannoside mannosyltransferase [Acidimicrobiales bacterium]RIK03658.1 MAG: glycosyltransferase family 1 protein [Acidobacteriota bacterium]
MRHLLVTNDFPPKVGGIQSYLWELWRRLRPEDFVVLTSSFTDSAAWDRRQPFAVERWGHAVLLPTAGLARRVNRLARDLRADLVVLDPLLPLGLLGGRLDHPYAVVLHGAEVAVPGRLPGSNLLARHVLRGAEFVISAGGYPRAEAERVAGTGLACVTVPPGVDSNRFVPLTRVEVRKQRAAFGLDAEALLVLGVSRLVPRKGMDTLIRAAAMLAGEVQVAVAGEGRDRSRLERLARSSGAPVTFLGRVPDADLPGLYGCADLFAMLCRNRWFGLEQEGFGIVFLEAAAAGVPQIAGRSGGAHEAVISGQTGLVLDHAGDASAVAAAIDRLRDEDLRREMAERGRRRAVDEFSYDVLAARLQGSLDEWKEGRR